MCRLYTVPGRRTELDVEARVDRIRAGELRAVSGAISAVERGSKEAHALLAALGPLPGGSRIVGITGPPGAGKSTTARALIAAYRSAGLRVGVVAVDPTSPFSGGAFLGDRIRMQDHAMDPDVFIRSMANRGELGGLTGAVPPVVQVLAAAGCRRILVETVGVGQAEIGVETLADSTVVLLSPSAGDEIQGAKAGILEVADVIVVNKADREGAKDTVRGLRYALSVKTSADDAWTPPILMTVASRGDGIAELVEALDRHFAWASASGRLQAKRRRRVAADLESAVLAATRARLRTPPGSTAFQRAIDDVLGGDLDLHRAAAALISAS